MGLTRKCPRKTVGKNLLFRLWCEVKEFSLSYLQYYGNSKRFFKTAQVGLKSKIKDMILRNFCTNVSK